MDRTNSTNNLNMLTQGTQQQDNTATRMKYIALRTSVVATALIGIVMNSIYGYVMPNTQVECLVDFSMTHTAGLNDYFSKNSQNKFFLLIFLSVCVDLTMILLGFLWTLHGKSWRLLISLVTFYIFKIFISIIFQEKRPAGYLWEYPGFPSLVVSYLSTETLFYSTVTGFLTIASLEFLKTENFYLFSFSFCVLLLDIFTRNILRANYIIDLICAIVIAHFIFILADEICESYLDNFKSEWLYTKKEEQDDLNNKEKINENAMQSSEGYITIKNKELHGENY